MRLSTVSFTFGRIPHKLVSGSAHQKPYFPLLSTDTGRYRTCSYCNMTSGPEPACYHARWIGQWEVECSRKLLLYLKASNNLTVQGRTCKQHKYIPLTTKRVCPFLEMPALRTGSSPSCDFFFAFLFPSTLQGLPPWGFSHLHSIFTEPSGKIP